MYACIYRISLLFSRSILTSKEIDNWLPSGDRPENFFGNIISTRLKYTILKPKYIGK
jgi:hypothetical protein